MEDFKGKLAIVTGAAKANGIGYAVALSLAERGCDVFHNRYPMSKPTLTDYLPDCFDLQWQWFGG
jgi:NAD(P)-dependent dehydrogenase (short-subunit alcohol dehydrogenase family)